MTNEEKPMCQAVVCPKNERNPRRCWSMATIDGKWCAKHFDAAFRNIARKHGINTPEELDTRLSGGGRD